MNNKNGFFASFTTRRSRLIIWSVIGLFLISNLGAVIDSFLHPEIPYFDSEHIIVGMSTALVFGTMLVMIIIYIERLEKAFRNISQTEEALQQKALQNSAILETAMDGFWLIDPVTQRLIDVNDAYCRMSGYSHEELLQMTIAQLEAVEKFDDVNAHQERVKNKKADRFETVHRRKDGSIFPVDISVQYLGETGKLFAFLRDITERKQAEENLRRRTEELTALQATILDISSPRSLPELLNLIVERAATLLGASGGGLYLTEPQQRKVRCVVSYNTKADFTGTLLDFGIGAAGTVAETGQPLIINDYSKWERRANVYEQEQPFQAVMSTPMLWYGKVSGVIHLLQDDVSKKFTREELNLLNLFANHAAIAVENARIFGLLNQELTEREQEEKALRASEEKWHSLVSAIPDYIALHDQEGHFLFLNHYAEGFTEKDVIGSSVFQYLLPESVELFRSNFEKALKTLTTQHFEHNAQGDRGAKRTYEDYLVPMHDKNQEINIMVISKDITERKRAEEEIRQLNAELEQRVEARTQELRDAQEQLVRHEKLAVLGQMASSVGHELRNPLGVISSAAYYLKLIQPDADDRVKQYLGIIDQEVRTSEKIITDLLDFARIKSVEREAVSVSQLIHQTLERFPVPASVEVTLEIPPNLPPVFVDPRHMTQVLGNLIVNAYQAMVPKGSTTGVKNAGQLSIHTRLQGDMIAIAVQDTGVGIPPENMKKLFEPLFTTKSKGIGLGLAVSRKLTEANGGRIEFESEAGKGSTFSVFLPVYKESK